MDINAGAGALNSYKSRKILNFERQLLWRNSNLWERMFFAESVNWKYNMWMYKSIQLLNIQLNIEYSKFLYVSYFYLMNNLG